MSVTAVLTIMQDIVFKNFENRYFILYFQKKKYACKMDLKTFHSD